MRNLEIEIFNFNKDILNFIKSLDKQEERNWCKKQIKTIINKIDKNDYSLSQFKIFYENCRNKKVSLKDRFIFKFGKLNGVLLYNEYLSKTKQNKETFIKRYGYSEGIKKFNIFKNKSDNKSLNFFIKKYGKDLGIQKYNENCKKMSENTSTSLKYFLNKGYTKQQALEKIKERNGVCSLKYQIKKYGKELGIKKYNEICKIRKKQNTLQFYIEKYGLIQGYIKYKNKNKKCKIDYTEKTYLKTLDSMVKNGRWISKELKKYKDLYYEIVKRETKKSLRKYKIKNFELVGDISKDRDNYHIDHKFSVSEGLKNNILPQIIGSIVNLECINGIENIKKQNKCSLTKKELFKRYKEFKENEKNKN